MILDEIKSKEIGIIESFMYGRKVFKETEGKILKICAILGIPISIVLAMISVVIVKLTEGINFQTILSNPNTLVQFANSQRGIAITSFNFIFILTQMALVPIVSMAVIYVCNKSLFGEKVSIKEAIFESFHKAYILVLASIIVGFVLLLGLGLFAIPTIYFYVMFMFYTYAIIIEDKGIIDCLKRSAYLVKGRFYKTFLYSAILFFINYNISYIFTSASTNILVHIVNNFIMFIINSVIVSSVTTYYISRKFAKEKELEN